MAPNKVCLNNKWGIVDESNEYIVPPKYDEIEILSENFCKVCLNKKWGIINSLGEEISSHKFKHIEKINDNSYEAIIDDQYGCRKFIDIDVIEGEVLMKIEVELDEYCREYIYVPVKYDWGGSITIGKKSFVTVVLDKKWGIINDRGEEIIPLKYDYLYYGGNYVCAGFNRKCGLIDIDGDVIVNFLYDSIMPLGDGKYAVNNEGRYRRFWEIPDEVDGGKTGVINDKGEFIIPMKYCFFREDYDEKKYVVSYSSISGKELSGKITLDGRLVVNNEGAEAFIPAEYDWGYDFIEGIAMVEKDGEYGFIDIKGNKKSGIPF